MLTGWGSFLKYEVLYIFNLKGIIYTGCLIALAHKLRHLEPVIPLKLISSYHMLKQKKYYSRCLRKYSKCFFVVSTTVVLTRHLTVLLRQQEHTFIVNNKTLQGQTKYRRGACGGCEARACTTTTCSVFISNAFWEAVLMVTNVNTGHPPPPHLTRLCSA